MVSCADESARQIRSRGNVVLSVLFGLVFGKRGFRFWLTECSSHRGGVIERVPTFSRRTKRRCHGSPSPLCSVTQRLPG